MKKWLKRILVISLILSIGAENTVISTAKPQVTAPSYIIMEASTGQIIEASGENDRRSPASITKIMTLLLIFDYLDKGRIHLDDEVMTSEHAKSMGGSQVFLEEGEIQTLDTIIKCIAVASGNDASVAAAEYIAGSESEFVNLMNEKAKELGMNDTHFEDCCGLSDSDEHYTSAKDVAIMSRELITKHPDIFNYTGIWMEDITHTTNQGTTNFTLSSTNKLLKMYEWTTGLKTGSTSKAGYCLSATAKKDDIELIAVVLGATSNKERFSDAMTLLNYGYGVSALYKDENNEKLPAVVVEKGVEDTLPVEFAGEFRYLDIVGSDLSTIEKTIVLPEKIEAPVKKGDAIGEAQFKLNGKRIGSISIVSTLDVERASFTDYLGKVIQIYLI